MAIPTAALVGFLLVLFRCAGLCSVAPLFGARAVPAQVRLGVALGISIAAYFGAGAPSFPGWQRTDLLLFAAFGETIVGLAAGLTARAFIEAAAGAGHLMGLSMGLGFAQVIDPLHGADSTALSELLAFVALGVAIAAGIHREAVLWLCRSLVEAPPGSAHALPELAGAVVAESVRSCALAVRISFPVLAAVIFGYVALGLVGRTAQQLAQMNLGFAVAIVAGGGALYLVAPAAAEIAATAARSAFAPR
jgi:flagellar biosynthetic protein FliR